MDQYFQDFPGPRGDVKAALDYFSERFLDLNPNPDDREIYVHETCATDTENIKFVDNTIRDTILRNLLSETFIS